VADVIDTTPFEQVLSKHLVNVDLSQMEPVKPKTERMLKQ
jgi:hypothetical protein